MIKSMTGYGKGETIAGDKKIIVEIRSLNSKQLDMSVRTPQMYRPYEYEIRNRVAKAMQRGKVDLSISCEMQGDNTAVALNGELFGAYYRQIAALAAENDIQWTSDYNGNITAAILKLPEVAKGEAAAVDDQEVAALNQSVDKALAAMDDFRAQEGKILINDILQRIDRIEELKEKVAPYETARTETIKSRIRENIEALSVQIDVNRLEQEMIYYIEKLDITEEKVRLQNHLNYFREVAGVAGEEGTGRKLGFISQEIGREINTMGSKANEANIQKIVVEMKDELEKIKEQLLNIL